jgi:hypothetical protein
MDRLRAVLNKKFKRDKIEELVTFSHIREIVPILAQHLAKAPYLLIYCTRFGGLSTWTEPRRCEEFCTFKEWK